MLSRPTGSIQGHAPISRRISDPKSTAACFYVVQSGTYAVRRPEDPDVTVKEYSKRDTFGSLGLLYNQPRASSIVCTAGGVLWAINRRLFNQRIRDPPRQPDDSLYLLLRSAPLLATLSDAQIRQLTRAAKRVHLRAGEHALQQGGEEMERRCG